MRKTNQLLAVLAAGLLAAPMVAQADYDFQLIDYDGTPDTQVWGVNNRGDVVGNGITNVSRHPFVYASKKGAFTVVAPEVGADTSVLGINDSGVMVGRVDNDAFIRDKKGNFTVFSHPDEPATTLARAVNNQGLVTGTRNRLGPDPFDSTVVGFIYDPKSDTYTDIIPPSDHTQSIAHGINSAGVVVGSAYFYEDDPCDSGSPDSLVRYGWRRATDGTVTYFSVNGWRTAARGINDSETIVGFVFDPNNEGKAKGFKVTLDGSQCQAFTVAASDLLEITDFDNLYPESINNSGVIAGIADDNGTSHGFIAKPGNKGKSGATYPSPARVGEYTYERIDPLGNGLARVFGLDETGNITGNIDVGDGDIVGFILNTKNGMLTLDPEIQSLWDINNSGAGAGNVIDSYGAQVCALRDKRGVVTTFTPPSSQQDLFTRCSARGRNDSGVVSGWKRENNEAGRTGENGWVGFIHDPEKATFEEFLPTAANEQTIVGQINAKGELAGGVYYHSASEVYEDSPPGSYGFRRNKDGSFKFFTINGLLSTRARGISDNGLMTGFFFTGAYGDISKGYVAKVTKGAGFENINIPDDQILDPGICVPVSTDPPYEPVPEAEAEWQVEYDTFSSAIANDGTALVSCNGYWILRRVSDGNILDYRFLGFASFIATPD